MRVGMMYPQQLTIDGRLEDIAPVHETQRLFEPVRTSRGQTMLATDPLEQLAQHASSGDWLAYRAMFVCCRPNPAVSARLAWERVASTRARYESDRAASRSTFHTVPAYAFPAYVPEHGGLEHGPERCES